MDTAIATEAAASTGRLGLVDLGLSLHDSEARSLEYHRHVLSTARDVLTVATVAGDASDRRAFDLVADGTAPTSAASVQRWHLDLHQSLERESCAHAGQHLGNNELPPHRCVLDRSATHPATDRHLVEAERGKRAKALDAAFRRPYDGEAVDEIVGQRAGLAGIAAGVGAHVVVAAQRLEHGAVSRRYRPIGLAVHHRKAREGREAAAHQAPRRRHVAVAAEVDVSTEGY